MANHPLRRILSLQSLLVALVPSLLAVFLGIFWFFPQISTDIDNRNRQLAGAITSQVENYLSTAMASVKATAAIASDKELAWLDIQHVLDAQSDPASPLTSLYIANRDGRVIAINQPSRLEKQRQELMGLELGHTPLFLGVAKEQRTLWSDTFLSIVGGGPAVAVAVPCGNNVAFGEVDTGRLTEFLKRSASGSGQIILLIDHRGQIITDHEGEYTAQQLNISNIPLIREGLSSSSPRTGKFRFNNQSMVGSIIKCSVIDWYVVVAQTTKSAYRPVTTAEVIIALGLLSSLLVGIGVAISLSRKLARPFEDLEANARALASGDDAGPWPQINIQEFNRLTEDLQLMATAIKLRERQLHESEQLLRSIMDNTYQYQGLLDPDGNLLDVNVAALELVGVTKASVVGLPFWETPWWAHDQGLQAKLRAEISKAADKEFSRFEALHPDCSGNLHTVDFSLKPMKAASGEIIYLIVEGRDITERKRLEAINAARVERGQLQQAAMVTLAANEVIMHGKVLDAARLITRTTANTLNVLRVGIWLLKEETGELSCLDLFLRESESHVTSEALRLCDYPRYFAAVKQEHGIAADDALTDPRTSELSDAYLRPLGISSMLVAPIRIEGENIGIVCVDHTGPARQWADDEIAFAWQIADQMALTMLHADLRSAYESLQGTLAALQASREEQRLVAQNVSDMIWTMDLSYRLTYANPAVTQITGWSVEEYLTMSIYDRLPPESLEIAMTAIKENLLFLELPDADRTLSITLELECYRKDGSTFIGEIRASCLWKDDGTPAGIIGVTRDITERKRAEEALRMEKAFSDRLIDSLPGIFYMYDEDLRLRRWNRHHEAAMGYTAAELSVMHIRDWHADPEIGHAIEQSVRQVLAGTTDTSNVSRASLKYRDGRQVPYLLTGVRLMTPDGAMMIGVGLDISSWEAAEVALQESEERFRTIFTNDDDALFLLKANDLTIIDANPTAQQRFGHHKESLTFRNFMTEEDLQRFCTAMVTDDNQRGFMLDRVTYFPGEDTPVYFAIKVKVFSLRDESVIFCSFRDITERIRMEEEIKTTQARMIQANKMASLGMLVSGVAHEINNPNQCIAVNNTVLTNIWRDASPIVLQYCEETGSASIGGLPSQELEDIVPQLFAGIAESSHRINAIVTSMRDFVTNGKERHAACFDINKAVTVAANILWHSICKYTDNFRQELAAGLPPVCGNAQQIEQVIINLLMNSLQALPDKSHEVSVATALDEDAGRVIITIKDTGKGMDPKTLQRLAEPFFTTREAEGGTGLGLYISTTIVKEYQGTLDFVSEPGKGTTAMIRLPIAANP